MLTDAVVTEAVSMCLVYAFVYGCHVGGLSDRLVMNTTPRNIILTRLTKQYFLHAANAEFRMVYSTLDAANARFEHKTHLKQGRFGKIAELFVFADRHFEQLLLHQALFKVVV